MKGGEQIVDPHADCAAKDADRVATVDWKQEGHRFDEVGGYVAAQAITFEAGLAHQAKVPQLQIAQPAVDELR